MQPWIPFCLVAALAVGCSDNEDATKEDSVSEGVGWGSNDNAGGGATGGGATAGGSGSGAEGGSDDEGGHLPRKGRA